MSELLAPFGAPPQRSADVEASPDAPALITEQQVLFATAAAGALQPAKTNGRWIGAMLALTAGLRAAFSASSNAPRPIRRHYPSRNDFLEDSRMAREMMRL
jgi:hypothetical protein